MRPNGPIPADIAIVGEAPGREEEMVGEPFVGASGRLLNAVLHSVGLLRTSCFATNVCRVRPPGNDISEWFSDNKKPPAPDWEHRAGLWHHPHIARGLHELDRELTAVRPRLILALGNTALWALTGLTGISKWRGSRLALDRWTVLPSLHPAAVLRQAELGPVFQMDLARAPRILSGEQQARPERFTIAPTFLEALDALRALSARPPARLSCDIETRAGAIACIGFAWTAEDAICIPLLRANPVDPFYWPIDQEAELRWRIHRLFQHPDIEWVGQNFLYDCQYFVREGMGYPRRVFDTMIGHHSLFSNTRKGLDFLSSMYCRDHLYWKDESKNWDPALGERQLWTYNCRDAVRTWEIADGIRASRDREAAR